MICVSKQQWATVLSFPPPPPPTNLTSCVKPPTTHHVLEQTTSGKREMIIGRNSSTQTSDFMVKAAKKAIIGCFLFISLIRYPFVYTSFSQAPQTLKQRPQQLPNNRLTSQESVMWDIVSFSCVPVHSQFRVVIDTNKEVSLSVWMLDAFSLVHSVWERSTEC